MGKAWPCRPKSRASVRPILKPQERRQRNDAQRWAPVMLQRQGPGKLAVVKLSSPCRNRHIERA
jgi:hypothetical protein